MTRAKQVFAAQGLWTRCAAILLGFSAIFALEAAEQTFETLMVDGVTYSNVVVVSQTHTHVMISHSLGMATLKGKNLDQETQLKLGFAVEEKPRSFTLPPIIANASTSVEMQELRNRFEKEVQPILEQMQIQIQANERDLMILAGIGGVIYLFFCYCCVQICRKTSNRPGLLVWIPGFQMIPLLRAAGMSPWLFILLLVPFVNVIVFIAWCVRICRVRQKSSLLAMFLIFPLTHVLAFLYLALSGHPKSDSHTEDGKIKLGFQPSAS